MNLTQPVHIAGVRFARPFMNGAYIGSKTLADVKTLAASQSGAIVVGSVTLQARRRNAGYGYWRHPEGYFSLNSFGMPNGGAEYFREHLPHMARLAHAHGKPLIVNLAGFTTAEFTQLIGLAQDAGADMVELNLGCPNVWENGVQKSIISYDPELVRDTLRHIRKYAAPTVPLAIKLSPLPPDILRAVANAITTTGGIQAVVATNSYPNARATAGETMAGGLTGKALKPISLGMVGQLRQLLPVDIDIIGCGGVSSADDVNDYLSAGAKAVQIATALVEEGPSVFDRLCRQTVPV